MTTFQFIAGMILCLVALGVRAYLLIQYLEKNKRAVQKNSD